MQLLPQQQHQQHQQQPQLLQLLLSQPSGSASPINPAGTFSKVSSSSKTSQASLIKTNVGNTNKSSAHVVNTSLIQSVKQEEEQRRLLSEPSGSVSPFHPAGVFSKGSSSSKMSQTSLIKTSEANIAKMNKSSANFVNTSLNQSVKQEEKEKSPVSGLYRKILQKTYLAIVMLEVFNNSKTCS